MPDTSKLQAFVDYAQALTGDEKGEAQIYLDRLFQAFEHDGLREAGATLEYRIKKESRRGTAFADLVWKPKLLVEMKKRGEDLSRHYRQAFDYWARLVPDRPRWVVLCNFDEFWVYDFENQMDTPLDKLALADLPTRWGALAFLFATEQEPVFGNDQQAVTRVAAKHLAWCSSSLTNRGVERRLAQRFILQMLAALFSEDIGLLERYTVARVIEDCRRPRDSYDLLGQLFTEMNTSGTTAGGRFKGVRYFNGGLFAEPARIELNEAEVESLKEAAAEDWSMVRPEIFGTIFEHSLDDPERHASGAHFTSAADIMKVVNPTIVRPWSDLIEGATTQKKLKLLHAAIIDYQVLDPACGSGNFLYIAYRELKRLELRILDRIAALSSKANDGQLTFGYVTARQFHGIDSNGFAIELAKLTMMIGRKLAIDELLINEPELPLDNLDDNFSVKDAVVDENGRRPTWPKCDVIIGNPPFLDARKLTLEHGSDYAKRLRSAYKSIPGRADYCVYWINRAAEHLPPSDGPDGVRGRGGLVGTNSIRQNYSREGGLDVLVAAGGTITDAVTSQVWSGDAAVNVSIVNWVNGPHDGLKILHEQLGDRRDSPWSIEEVSHINSALSGGTDVSRARALEVVTRTKLCFEGIQPGHKGFRFNQETLSLLASSTTNLSNVVFQYLNGDSLVTRRYADKPEFIVDFREMPILKAAKYTAPLALIENRVLPDWKKNADKERAKTGKETGEHQNRMNTWWQLKRKRQSLINAIAPLSRYVVCVRHTKRPIFEFIDSQIRPDSALTVFAFEDDYSFGILQSRVHWEWFLARCSSLKRDHRYTNETVFDSFPWPQRPKAAETRAVAKRGRELRAIRNEALVSIEGGLRGLYKLLEKPGTNALREAHKQLDIAVLKAYGFSSRRDLVAQTLSLNAEVAAAKDPTAPGLPPKVPLDNRVLSADCVPSVLSKLIPA